jgi:hypothetical protein
MLRLFELVRIAFTLAFAEKLDPKLRQLTRRLQPNFVFDFQSTVRKSAGAHRSSQNQPAGGSVEALDGPSLERAAARDDVNAEAELGFRYLTGCKAFNCDYDEAAQLFRRAADAGNSKAQFYLASMFKEGRGAQV